MSVGYIACMFRDSPMSVHVTFFTHTHTRGNPRQAQARRNLRFCGETHIARQHAQDACQHAHTRQPPSSAARRALDRESHHVVSTSCTLHSCTESFGTWRNKLYLQTKSWYDTRTDTKSRSPRLGAADHGLKSRRRRCDEDKLFIMNR